MEYSKEIKISRKIINKNDLFELGSILISSWCEGDYELNFQINFTDNSSIKGNELDIFNNPLFTRKTSSSIFMYYRGKNSKDIDIKLYSNQYIDSKIEIRSSDITWYESKLNKFEEIITTMKKQSFIGITNNSVFAFTLLCSLINIIWLLPILMLYKALNILNIFNLVSIVSTGIIVGAISLLTTNQISKIYPNIEFDFGTLQNSSPKNKRQILNKLISTIIIPAIFLILSLIIKK